MKNVSAAVEAFFRRFELNGSKSGVSETITQFADTFMAAGPQGAQCVRASDFALALPKRKQLFDSYGCQPMQLVSVDARALGERYAMAHTRWRVNFEGSNSRAEPIDLETTFLLDTAEDPFRIVLYLAHQDIFAMLKERASAKA